MLGLKQNNRSRVCTHPDLSADGVSFKLALKEDEEEAEARIKEYEAQLVAPRNELSRASPPKSGQVSGLKRKRSSLNEVSTKQKICKDSHHDEEGSDANAMDVDAPDCSDQGDNDNGGGEEKLKLLAANVAEAKASLLLIQADIKKLGMEKRYMDDEVASLKMNIGQVQKQKNTFCSLKRSEVRYHKYNLFISC